MTQEQEFVSTLLSLKAKNLQFFQRTFPGIYEFFAQYELKQSQLDVQPQAGELDLIENGKHIYNGGLNYGAKECAHFLSLYDYGGSLHSVKPLYEGEYKNPRYFAQYVDEIYQASPLKKGQFRTYTIPDFFPMMVFMGCGLGVHIQHLCQQRKVQHVCVVETNMDRFAASLYVTDWEALASPFIESDDQSFNFILIPQQQSEQAIRDVVWNKLIEHCPVFPVMTLYYNHLGNPLYDRVIDAINADLYVHLLSFGNYDDELNQLNNAIHNFKQEAKRLPLPANSGFNFPVCVVGSGPSLDERAEWLRDNQDKVIIVSCGTALRALGELGIQADFHVELESDYRTFTTQSLTEDKEYVKSVKLIGAAQLTPLMLGLFSDVRLFFKAEGVLQGLFATDSEAIREAAPTCTNAGLALAFHYGFSRIFLFGLDYGFPDKSSHHARGSLYYKDDGDDSLKEAVSYKEGDLLEVEAAAGGKIMTTNFLYTSKRRTENIIWGAQHPHIFNCSSGSKISSTEYISSKALFESVLKGESSGSDVGDDDCHQDISKSEIVSYLFSDDCIGVSCEEIEKQTVGFEGVLLEVQEQCLDILTKPIENIGELSSVCACLNNYVQHELKDKSEHMYYFIRGSVWHFLHAGFSHAVGIEHESEVRQFIEVWQAKFVAFLEGLVDHYRSVIFKDFDIDQDLLVRRSISDREEDPPEFRAPDFSELQWTFTGQMVNDSGCYFSCKQ